MCMIVDSCIAGEIASGNAELSPLVNWLTHGDGKLVHGGLLTRELTRNVKFLGFLSELNRSGKAIRIPDEPLREDAAAIARLGINRSNDLHVIALARISGARLLCSSDRDLHKDFKNRRLLAKPRGRVYQSADHDRLLRNACRC